MLDLKPAKNELLRDVKVKDSLGYSDDMLFQLWSLNS